MLEEIMAERGLDVKTYNYNERKVKPMLGFKSLKTAEKTICGIEIMHMIRKRQVEEIRALLSKVEFLNRIMCEVA
jgi:transposase, IS6 family